jgi:VCBS repeat-containing protein
LSNAPVAMDMNGDGTITYVGRNLTKAKFNFSRDDDEESDQSTEITAWVANGDGFLAFDKDTNGIISKTSELAFTCYDDDAKTDLEALRRYFDRDEFGRKDGFLNANDIYYERFGVWVDQNLPGKLGDGICQPGEFKSLKELKITQIKLTVWGGSIKPFTVAEADNDVTVFGRTQFTINGVQRRAEDVRLATNLPDTATIVSTPDFSASEDIILASGFIQKGAVFNTSQVKVYVSPLAVSLVDVPPGGGYNFIYSTRDGGLVYFSDTVNYNTASNPSYFCGIIPLSSFAGTGTTPPTLAEIELQLTNAIRANPVTNQILSPKANGSLPPANFAPDIRNDTTRGSINFDPLTPVWSNAQVTVSGGTEDSLAASGQFNVVDLNTLDVVRAAVDAVTPVWTQRVGTVAIPTPLSNASLLAMLDIRDSYGNRNPIALAADPFLGSTLKWNFNQNDPGVINPFGTSNSFDWLAAGESVALTYTIKVTDKGATSQPSLSDTQQLIITINGVNDGPIASADLNGSDLVTEAGVKPVKTAFPGDSSATGNLLSNDTDLDLTDTKTVITTGTFSGIYGSVVIGANGVWTYTLNNTDPDTNALAQNSIVTDVFAYTMQDNNGASSS